MIEINLSPKASGATDLTNVGGFNLSLLNIKMLLIALLILYIPEPLMQSYYDDKIQKIETKASGLRKVQRGFTRKLTELDNIRKKIERLNKLEKKLEKKIKVVKTVVNKRQNPFKVLKYIAENTPNDLWVKKMIVKDSVVKITGYSMNWQIIGEFIENLKQSVFFDRNIRYKEPSGLDKKFRGKTLHTYEVNARIVSFE